MLISEDSDIRALGAGMQMLGARMTEVSQCVRQSFLEIWILSIRKASQLPAIESIEPEVKSSPNSTEAHVNRFMKLACQLH